MMPIRLRLVTGFVVAVWCLLCCPPALAQMPEPITDTPAQVGA